MMISVSEIKRSILALSKKGKDNLLFKQFLDSFFSYIPFNDQNKKSVEELYDIAALSYKFFKRKTEGSNIYIVTSDDINISKGEVVVVILNDDMPFLVDSITECFNRQKYHIQRIVNATFNVSRSKDGKLVDIGQKSKGSNESIVYVKLSNVTSCTNIEDLKSHCEFVLNNVRAAVDDWKVMSGNLQKHICSFVDHGKEDIKESRLFLEWLLKDNFIFVGSKEYVAKNGSFKDLGQGVGIFRAKNKSLSVSIKEDIFESNNFEVAFNRILIGRIREISSIHRSQNLDYVCVLMPASKNEVRVVVFLGLFVSRLHYQSVFTIPIIRKKVEEVVAKSGFLSSSFNAKELVSILETLPKKELLQMSNDEVYNVAMTLLSCVSHPRLVLFIKQNTCTRFVDVNIVFPRKRLTSDITHKVQETVTQYIPGTIIDTTLSFFSMGLAYMSVTITVDESLKDRVKEGDLEDALDKVTSQWSENLGVALEEHFGSKHSVDLIEKYSHAFDQDYAFKFSLGDAIYDISAIEQMLSNGENILFKLCQDCTSIKTSFCFKVYGLNEKVALYQIMPLFDNLGFKTIEEDLFVVTLPSMNQKIWIQYFILSAESKNVEKLKDNKVQIEEAIQAIFYGAAKNDITNQLIFKAGFSWRQVFLVNAYCKYLLQIKFVYSQEFIKSTLVKYPNLSKLIIDLFYSYFDVNSTKKQPSDLEGRIKISLSKIHSMAEYKVMLKFVELVQGTLRTNYFQAIDGIYKSYVSLKIDSSKISDIPLPKPFVEIFVYSLDMEGIHLRGGKISRGGIRWSDRVEDYRTEVLGLMKSQMTKNTIIVPDGSKGGFIIKKVIDSKDREGLFLQSIECYKTFLRGMLDVTDNMCGGNVCKPKDVVCRDGDDPYLVVAADKGTATFSDIANDVAKNEYGFWLGDGFASGGAVGYDHKEMGITARGAWISVMHHFNSLGLDPQKDVFTAVGIGDMSGDVFGNGMLLSNKMKLVAAFNHMHIFVDPNPDPKISYKERQRMFKLSRSTWDDYNKELISAGGGVFERSAKSIKVSKEMKKLLSLSHDKMEPNVLIRAILMAQVDLIWNGGIGTYVKSHNEVNLEIGNKSNDDVRVDANDLRCRVFSEGGNLGMTQLGRVEFAFIGGNVNTDSVDNSAGVDCSDHEVNIKIVLDQATSKKKITHKERDNILLKMKGDVADLVLYDNKIQNQNISIEKVDSEKDIHSYAKLIGFLEETADLNPKVEFLPSQAELSRRKQNNLGLSRPEIAVLMAYSKRSVYNSLINSSLPSDTFYQKYLFSYFPGQMTKVFSAEIESHPLYREIIATCATNEFVNYVGLNFYHIACEFTGLSGCDVIRAFSVSWETFNLAELWHNISEVEDFYIRIDLYTQLRSFIHRVIFWLLKSHKHPLNVTKLVGMYKQPIMKIHGKISDFLSRDLQCEYSVRLDELKVKQIPDDLAVKIASLDNLYYVLDVLWVSCDKKYNLTDVLTLYFEVGERFYYNWLNSRVDSLPTQGHWDRMLIKSVKDDIDLQHRDLVIEMMKLKGVGINSVVDKWTEKNLKKVEMFSVFIKSIMSLEDLDHSKLIIAVKQGNVLLGGS